LLACNLKQKHKMTTEYKVNKGIAGTGTGAAIEATAAQLTSREARIFRRVKRRQERAAVHAAELSRSRSECEARRGLRVAAMPSAIASAIAADKQASKVRRKSVRDAIAAHDACLVPAAGSKAAGRGGWDGAGRVEVAIWRGAARLAATIAKRRGERGQDAKSGIREIVYHQVPGMIEAARVANSRGDFKSAIRPLLFAIETDTRRYFDKLRDERRRQSRREDEASGIAGMDDWQDRDEFTGGACSPWSPDQCAAAHAAGVELPILISSEPRKLASGGAGMRRGVAWGIVGHAPAIVGAAMLKSIKAAAGKGKGQSQRDKSAASWKATADCVAIVCAGGILPPAERAGLSSGAQGGIGKAWERRIEKLRAEIGGKVNPLSPPARVPILPPVAAEVGTLGAAMAAAGL